MFVGKTKILQVGIDAVITYANNQKARRIVAAGRCGPRRGGSQIVTHVENVPPSVTVSYRSSFTVNRVSVVRPERFMGMHLVIVVQVEEKYLSLLGTAGEEVHSTHGKRISSGTRSTKKTACTRRLPERCS